MEKVVWFLVTILSTAHVRAVGMERQREKKKTCTNPNIIIYEVEAGKLHIGYQSFRIETQLLLGHSTVWSNPIFKNVVVLCGFMLPYLTTCH